LAKVKLMLRFIGAFIALLAVCACGSSGFAMRPVPRIAADSVGQPVSRLNDAFGEPRKVDATATKVLYVWFIAQTPAGAPAGFHGCELEATVDPRSNRVLGYSLSSLGWSQCKDIERRIRVAAT
jgi:hypothetical protein